MRSQRRTVRYKQGIDMGIDRMVIMPTYGTLSYEKRGEFNLPKRYDRDEKETNEQFIKRVEDDRIKLHDKIWKKYKKLDFAVVGLWVKASYAKSIVIDHDYIQPTR